MANFRLWSRFTVLCLLNLILGATDGLSMPESSMRTCVIGAGYSGLGTARYLKEYDVDFTVFEASRHIGGTWRFDPRIGTDEDGIPLFTSMYKGLRTNTPRQTMEYNGFPFPDGTPTYPEGGCFYKYLKAFAKNFDILDHIQYQSLVTSVSWAGNHWNVTYMKSDTKQNRTEACDFVVVANGEIYPLWPKIDGMDTFEGTIMHSHDYKEPEPFRDRRVMLIGAGASGLDLAMHLSNVTSKLVHSHHLDYNQPNFSKTYVKKSDVKTFTKKGVLFEDDSFEEIDVVILCTGYTMSHKFLDESCGVVATERYVVPLYRQIINIKHPTMGFIGVTRKIINRVLDAQGQYVAALAAGKFKLPSQDEMLKIWLDHVNAQKKEKLKLVDVNFLSDMDQYFANMTEEAGVDRAPPVLTMMRDFNARNRLEDILNYRDYDWTILDDVHYKREYVPRKDLPCPIDNWD